MKGFFYFYTLNSKACFVKMLRYYVSKQYFDMCLPKINEIKEVYQ